MSQAFGARSGLQGMVSSEAGGANEANGSRGLLGPWVLDSWEELRRRRRGKEDEQLKASTSSSIGAGPLANRTVRHRDCEEAEGIGYKAFSHLHPLFLVFSFISTELGSAEIQSSHVLNLSGTIFL